MARCGAPSAGSGVITPGSVASAVGHLRSSKGWGAGGGDGGSEGRAGGGAPYPDLQLNDVATTLLCRSAPC